MNGSGEVVILRECFLRVGGKLTGVIEHVQYLKGKGHVISKQTLSKVILPDEQDIQRVGPPL